MTDETFMGLYMKKQIGASEIDAHISAWHADGNPSGPSLHDYLGLTLEEFGSFVRGTPISAIRAERWKQQGIRISSPTFITALLIRGSSTASFAEARRLVAEGAVRVDGVLKREDDLITESCLVQVGRRTFLKVIRE